MIEKNIEMVQQKGGFNKIMGTIKLPKNMDMLIKRLPKKNYTSVRVRANSVDMTKKNPYDSEKPVSKIAPLIKQ